jgi:hypothetical protein
MSKRLAKKKPLVITSEAPTRSSAPPLVTYWTRPERWYIAVHENGFGAATDLAKAILVAQESVAFESKPSQLAIYVSDIKIEPTGFVTWSNGVQPRLIGLTNTHQGWLKNWTRIW